MIKVKVSVAIPRGDKCEGCRFLIFHEPACDYWCALFNEWDLGFYEESRASRSEDAYKCTECRDLKEETDND